MIESAKYVVFAFAALGMPPLVLLLFFNLRWVRHLFWGIVAALCLYQETTINFFSREYYTGTARGMEVSLVHLLALAFLAAFFLRKKIRGWLPDGGIRIYALYFLLCLPSLTAADDRLLSWFELWKMTLLPLVFLAVYNYLRETRDIKTPMAAMAFLVFVNFIPVVQQHYSISYQAHGVFPHHNSMALALHLLGALFFAHYLTHGARGAFGKTCFLAFCLAMVATLWSYSRGAFAVMPFGYGITLLACFLERRHTMQKARRLLLIALIAILGLAVMFPRIVKRFVDAPAASGDTRVELAYCALEMIKDEPLRGVGINNWRLRMEPEYPYQENAGRILGYELNHKGIVETVYLLVGAECGIPALLAMLAWFGWYWIGCIRLLRRLRGTSWFFVPAGLLGGLTADYMQSALEWVLRQPQNMILLMTMFAIIGYLNTNWPRLVRMEAHGKEPS